MAAPAPPSILPTSALGVGVEAFVAVRAATHAGIADARATFEYSLSAPSRDVGFMLFAGLEPLLDALERFKPKADELAWLESIGVLDAATRRRLADVRFACDVDAAPEGSVVFGNEPVLTVEGPYWQAQLVGALVEAALGDATLAATRIARCVTAADGAVVLETTAASARRLGGAPLLARAAYIAGAHATTSALAGKRYGVPVRSLQPAHIAFAANAERALFDAWLAASPRGAVVRLDPRSPRESLEALVATARELKRSDAWDDSPLGVEVAAVDAPELARDITLAFEDAGLRPPEIIVAGARDEIAILELRRQAAPIAAFCASTHVSVDASTLSRYALVALEEDGAWSPRAQPTRAGDPARKMIIRYLDADQRPVADVAHLANERIVRARDGRYVDRATDEVTQLRGATSSAPLLANVMRAGKRAAPPEPARLIRERAQKALAALPSRFRRLVSPARYPVGATSALAALRAELTRK